MPASAGWTRRISRARTVCDKACNRLGCSERPGATGRNATRRRGMNWESVFALVAGVGLALPAAAQERAFRVGLITPSDRVWNQEVAALNETLQEVSDGRLSL